MVVVQNLKKVFTHCKVGGEGGGAGGRVGVMQGGGGANRGWEPTLNPRPVALRTRYIYT